MVDRDEPHAAPAFPLAPTDFALGRAALFKPRPFSMEDYVASRPVSRRGRSLYHLEEPKPYVEKTKPLIWAPYGLREPEHGTDKDDVESQAHHARVEDAPYEEPEIILDEPEPEPEASAEAEVDLFDAGMPWPMPTDLDAVRTQHEDDASLPEPRPGKNSRRRAADRDPDAKPRRLGRSAYDAMETHGHFGLVDGGETSAAGLRRVIVHVPKRNRGYALDVKQGDLIFANSARGKPVGGRLEVAFVSRHRYTPPGHAVSSCIVGIPEHQWRRFRD